MAPTAQLPAAAAVPTKDCVTFTVNGETHTVGREISSDVMLVDYLRNSLRLSGTKFMCREGGCGVCCVTVVKCPGGPVVSVNSCMVAIMSCQDWAITTIEEIGNRKKGYHILQKTLAKFNGTQCGYCTPAWIQNMYSLLQNGNKPTMADIEKSFGSNICRCTGYRPILEAFKKFGSDAPPELKITDIEDLQICKTTGKPCKGKCENEKGPCDKNGRVINDEFDVINEFDDWCLVTEEEVKESNMIAIQLKDNKWWFKVCDLKSIFDILNVHGYDSYMLVYGNTAKGAYPKDDRARINIDITTVPELKSCQVDQNLIVGVGVTLNELLEVFKSVAKEQYFGYLNKFVEHINLVASIPIRNLGSLGGNLMIKHENREFPSDLFLLLETVDAYLTIYTSQGVTKKLSMQQFLSEDMTGKIIVEVMLPPICETCKFISYKVMPRSQSAHAMVNAGFLYKLATDNTVTEARITFGGLSPTFIRAENTERYLVGKPLFSDATLQGALNVLDAELVIGYNPPETSVAYRRQLSLSLFYKGLLSLSPKNILNPRHLSATTKIHETRPVSQGRQIFYTNPSLWPLNQPIEKVEALIQCAGETKYTDDIQPQPREVYAAFVMSDVAMGDLVHIDTSLVKDNTEIIAIYTAADIPGVNSFIPSGNPFFEANEEVLASAKVSYFNQPIAIVVAKSQHLANTTAKLVKATYTNTKKPTTDIKLAKNDASRLRIHTTKPATETGTDVVRTIKGENTIYSQLHVTMENMSCLTIPTEEGLECHITSQWLDGCHLQISKALNMDESKIDVYARRLGGAYGLKISRSNQIAVACSLVTNKLNLPCRFVVPFTTCTRAIGKRYPCHAEYEVAVNAEGVIQSNIYKQYEDNGFMYDEAITMLGADAYNNCYTNTKWDLELYDARTDTAKNTWCRSPGTLEGIALAEHLVERIATELDLCPWAVRIANVDPKYNAIIQMAEDLKRTSNYEERKAAVHKFNCENRWRKRGIRCSFSRWTPAGNSIFEINISVYHGDGSVAITHGGIEMGQGINTKAVQICAYILKIPIEKIQVKGNNTIIAPNCFATGGSLGSQNVGLGVKRCCEALLERLEPIRKQMDNPTWLELITQAYAMGVDLQAHNHVNASDVFEYDIYGVALAEVELDVLTGESEIRRVDIMQDAGQSVSPEIDVGQVEGAFLMGQGYWTSEDLVYDRYTGELLSDRTWNYYVPLATDIPQDWRIAFREKSYSDPRILGAKGTGEPPMCLAVVIAFALRAAISASLKEIGIPSTTWHQMEGPSTVEKVNLASGVRKEDFCF